ncbi:hypothetical protein [Mycolicibacterium sp. XJ1819]
MLPSRPTLQGWNPDALVAAADTIGASADEVVSAVGGIEKACARMPEMRAWEGRAHSAALAMFLRANDYAADVGSYGKAVAAAVRTGADALGAARAALLRKADEIEAGPLRVTDDWAVLVDAVRMSAEQFAELAELAAASQDEINDLLGAVGDADDKISKAIRAAMDQFGMAETDPISVLFALSGATPPADEVTDPRDPLGVLQQEALRDHEMALSVREVAESENEYGDEVTTMTMQDGSRHVITKYDPFDWPSRQDFFSITQYDRKGVEISRASSWRDLGNDCDYTSFTWADGSNFTMSMDPTGHSTAGFTAAGGHHVAVPVELVDNLSLSITSHMAGLEAQVGRGGTLPMLTAESVEKVGRAAKFGGPALTFATTVFDMLMAETAHDACVAAVGGAGSGLGSWGLAKGGAALAAATGVAPVAVPLFAIVGAFAGVIAGDELGEMLGEIACP